MSTIKKAFQPLVDFLNENKDKKVSTILPQAIALCSTAAKKGGSKAAATLRNNNGDVIAIRDYFYSRWMPLVGELAADFAAKPSNASGYNSMSIESNKLWTKANNARKKAMTEMLALLRSGQMESSEMADAEAVIAADFETARDEARTTEVANCFDTVEDLYEYLREAGEEFTELPVAE